ncbi:MAG: hypothetical protein HC828_08995 [Blastochloris sp.]|nr:hypothetical protein [Blastochloris sp.]
MIFNVGANAVDIATSAGSVIETLPTNTAAHVYLGVSSWVVQLSGINTARVTGVPSRTTVVSLDSGDTVYSPICVDPATQPPDPNNLPAGTLAIDSLTLVGFVEDEPFWQTGSSTIKFKSGPVCYTPGSYVDTLPVASWDGVFDDKISDTEWRITGDVGNGDANYHNKRKVTLTNGDVMILSTQTRVYLYTDTEPYAWRVVFHFTAADNTITGSWFMVLPLGETPVGPYDLNPDDTAVSDGACYVLNPNAVAIVETP